jgi:hypothetical protein
MDTKLNQQKPNVVMLDEAFNRLILGQTTATILGAAAAMVARVCLQAGHGKDQALNLSKHFALTVENSIKTAK